MLPPPLRRDPLGPLHTHDVMHRPPPHEPPRHAFGGGVNDIDRFRPVEETLGAIPLRARSGRGTIRRVEGSAPNTTRLRRAVPLPQLAGGGADSRHPPARALGQMAFERLRPA